MGRKSRLKAMKRASKKDKSKNGAAKEMRDASTQTPEETQLVLVPTDYPQGLIWDEQQMPRVTTEEIITSDIIEDKKNVSEAAVVDKTEKLEKTEKSLNKND
ncbi:uncharacterized protein LOC118186653 [Stegodyphus dumicola]|uniref:uncharacterized protein LOC118186653 n=1 Tax=Stegodyphus dumicola TaxID=202533 RepID=UPI0015B1CC6B|nr:uncharacterized protein LOC118186653 [Stegodyphus dumicola]